MNTRNVLLKYTRKGVSLISGIIELKPPETTSFCPKIKTIKTLIGNGSQKCNFKQEQRVSVY